MTGMQRLFAALSLLTGAAAAQAQLQARDLNGDGSTDAFYDPAQDISWLADANHAATTGYVMHDPTGAGSWLPPGHGNPIDASTWASQLDLYGTTDWRLPAAFTSTDPISGCGSLPGGVVCVGFVSLETELTRLYSELGGQLGMFGNVQSLYWSQTYTSASGGLFAQYFDPATGRSSGTDEMLPYAFAWAVHDGDVGQVTAVPEPSTYALMALGLGAVGLSLRRRGAKSRR